MMLPFVYPMDAISAFAFLLGMHAVTATTGDITSVLFGIPGEATSAATVLDGYPMTRRGEGGRALGAVLFSSLVGALLGAAVLAVSVPVIRPVVLQLGPPEFLMLTVLGLSFIVSLAGRNLIKGFLMAAFGFLLAMVGLDPQSSIQRFTFGQLYLWEGINVVPVVVGLFGGAEVLQLMMTKQSIARRGEDARLAGVMQGVRDTFEHWSLTLRASAIGVGIGVIPGMGGAVSQFIAYAHAQHTSKHPETFGKGNVEGVLATGAVNNSREGGNLIPTVAFGIPGSVSMAILLSVFLLKGLVPGPAMLTRNLDVTYAMVWVIVISNIIAVGVSFLFLNQLVRLTYVKATLLVPFLMVLTAFGAYTAHNSLNDILLMLAATVVGIAAIKWDWPRAPLLLALVLGDIAERYLFLSVLALRMELADAAAGHGIRSRHNRRPGVAPHPRPPAFDQSPGRLAGGFPDRDRISRRRDHRASRGARLALPHGRLPAGDRPDARRFVAREIGGGSAQALRESGPALRTECRPGSAPFDQLRASRAGRGTKRTRRAHFAKRSRRR